MGSQLGAPSNKREMIPTCVEEGCEGKCIHYGKPACHSPAMKDCPGRTAAKQAEVDENGNRIYKLAMVISIGSIIMGFLLHAVLIKLLNLDDTPRALIMNFRKIINRAAEPTSGRVHPDLAIQVVDEMQDKIEAWVKENV